MMLSYAPVIIWVLRQYFNFVMCTGISIDLRALYVMTFSLVDVVTCSTFSGSDLELLISNCLCQAKLADSIACVGTRNQTL